MAFEGLSEKLNGVFKRLKSRGKLSEADVKEAMREVKMALLEADVSYKVVKDFIAKVTERSVGEEVLKSLTPGQQVIKIVNDELIKLMGVSVSLPSFESEIDSTLSVFLFRSNSRSFPDESFSLSSAPLRSLFSFALPPFSNTPRRSSKFFTIVVSEVSEVIFTVIVPIF